MKKKSLIIAGILLTAIASQGAVVYTEDFAPSTTLLSDSSDPWEFGGANPDVGTEQWFSARTTISLASEALAFGADTQGAKFVAPGEKRPHRFVFLGV